MPDGNLIIHGDNLLALKALLPRYAGRVNCIYIDPPYNTGNDTWVYKDNVNSPLLQEWLSQNSEVDGEDLERHEKWLCMMWPRLQLLKDLLAEDGVIFVSIDDNEQHRLRAVMDEVFGELNCVTNVVWEKKYSPQNDAKWFSDNHDFVVCYASDKTSWQPSLLPRSEKQNARYTNRDNDPRGPWKSSGLDVKTYLAENDYPITTPSGRIVNPPTGRCWVVSKERLQELISDNRIWFGKDGSNVPSIKRFLADVKDGVTPLTVWRYDDVGHNQSGTQELRRMGLEFPNPKPHTLLKRILHLGTQQDAIVLDSFAGGGTTGHATLALNREDGGNRRFILVECEDYADTITAERVRRVIKGVPDAKDEALREGLGGSFTYCTLGEPIDSEQMLSGEALPSYVDLASHLLHTAVGKSVAGGIPQPADGDPFHADEETDYYLLYRPDADWLRGPDSMFTTAFADRITQRERPAVVFAAGKYMSQRDLTPRKITFCQLPYELHRSG
ncbi:MAG: site-specific DNA-methyltransferase [Chloroflexi bacterium]|nr:site-specific DNA-methyltransferase [Chloroflexota bacterium]